MSRLVVLLLLGSAAAFAAPAPTPAAEPECVVLLHGIGMRSWVMSPLAARLRDAGYRTVNLSYPSRRASLEDLAGPYLSAQLRAHDVTRAPRVHFVTHSMGGIILRMHLRESRPANLGRVVMIAPPNHGSAAADAAHRNPLLRAWFGPNLPRLGTGQASIVPSLAPLDFEAGVIAGDRPLNPLFGRALAGPHDGAVTVESTRIEGMAGLHRPAPLPHWSPLAPRDRAPGHRLPPRGPLRPRGPRTVVTQYVTTSRPRRRPPVAGRAAGLTRPRLHPAAGGFGRGGGTVVTQCVTTSRRRPGSGRGPADGAAG